jgi:anti-anti-sigma regulatory factor
MLRITSRTGADGLTVIVLEGRLAGPWAEELARCWATLAAAQDARRVSVALDAVTFIDAAGRSVLRTMHENGAALTASGPMTRAIVEEITQH